MIAAAWLKAVTAHIWEVRWFESTRRQPWRWLSVVFHFNSWKMPGCFLTIDDSRFLPIPGPYKHTRIEYKTSHSGKCSSTSRMCRRKSYNRRVEHVLDTPGNKRYMINSLKIQKIAKILKVLTKL